MKYSVSFIPEIENDALSSYHWYENKSKGLGEDFLRMFYAGATDLIHNPLIYQKVYKNFRRKLIRRFPYAIYYIVKESKIIIYGLFHTARNPQSMKDILSERE